MNNLQKEIWELLDEKQPLNHTEILDGLNGASYGAMCSGIFVLKDNGLIVWEDHGYRFTTREEELEFWIKQKTPC